MISKQTANRVKEIDFETIINSDEPGGLIRHLVLHAQNLETKKQTFFAASAVYYSYLMGIKRDETCTKVLNEDTYLLAWVNTCIAEPGSESDNLLVMLAGIYQLIEWEKEC